MKRYRLYVDESGDHGYWELDNPANRYLCLLGLFAETEAYRSAFYRLLYDNGTYSRRPEFFRRALTSHEIKLKPKSANIAGLQVADLLAYPVKQDILLERGAISEPGDVFGREICRVLEPKYNRQVYQGRITGYSKIFL